MSQFFKKKISKDQSKDTGMAMVLIFLLAFIGKKREGYLLIAVILHILNMVVPKIYRPIAILWLGISDAMGNLVSKVVLSILFFVVVTPLGILRRLMGKDSLKLRGFKQSRESVLIERNHVFAPADLKKPY
jgi:Saxitoxin biosynthesis operon protein SxtJ